MNQRTLAGSIAIALVCLVIGSGCIVSVNETRRDWGSTPDQTTLSQIVPGETTVEWLLAVAGPPARREQVEDGPEILRYERGSNRDQDVAVFVLFQGSTDIRESEAVLVEVQDGIIQRYWIESDKRD